MLRLRQEQAHQLTLFDELLPAEVRELPPDLAKLDRWLDDERFFEPFRDKYHARLGRPSIPAETYLRLMALKHQHGLSDRQLCAAVQDRISWRRFCRVPWTEPVPHPSSLTKIRHRLDQDGSDHMAELNEHLVRKACETGLLRARKLRVDTTVIEANLHHPTDASLIWDGVRTITRLVQKARSFLPASPVPFRNRTRSLKKRLLRITKVLRRRTGEAVREVRRITGEMAVIGEKAVQAATQVTEALLEHGDAAAERVARTLMRMTDRTRQVIEQARQVNAGNLHLPHRLVSVFDPEARPIRRGKAQQPTEFGYKVCLTESEEQLITGYAVYVGNPSDKDLLVPNVQEHIRRTGRVPKRTATDRGFWARDNERVLQSMGIQQVSLPYRGKRTAKRYERERQSWFQRLQRWRAGQEGTLSVLKRRYGLNRTRYRGRTGCQRWVGGVIWAYNLNRMAQRA